MPDRSAAAAERGDLSLRTFLNRSAIKLWSNNSPFAVAGSNEEGLQAAGCSSEKCAINWRICFTIGRSLRHVAASAPARK